MANEEKSLVAYVDNLITYVKSAGIVAADLLIRAESLAESVCTLKLVLGILTMMEEKDKEKSEEKTAAVPTTLSGGALGFAITEKLLQKITFQKGFEEKLQVAVIELTKVWPFLSKNLTLITQLCVHYSVHIMRAEALIKSSNIEVAVSLMEAKEESLLEKNLDALKSLNDLTASAVTYKKSLKNAVEDSKDDLEKALKILNVLYEELMKKSSSPILEKQKEDKELKEIKKRTTERSYEMMKKYFNIILDSVKEILMFLNKNNDIPELVPETFLN
jgi:hypothetical protein